MIKFRFVDTKFNLKDYGNVENMVKGQKQQQLGEELCLIYYVSHTFNFFVYVSQEEPKKIIIIL